MKIIKRTHTFTLPLSEAFSWFGVKSEYDEYEDVTHGGYHEKDIKNMHLDIPESCGGDRLLKYFPNLVARALEDCDRQGYVSAMNRAAEAAVEENLLKIEVPGEYVGINQNEEEVSVAVASCVEKVEIDRPNEEVRITIKNPEHLINDLISGDGISYFSEILVDTAQNKEIQRRLFLLERYFEIYGVSAPGIPDRIEPDYNDDWFEDILKGQLECDDEEETIGRAFNLIEGGEDTKDVVEFLVKYMHYKKDDVVDRLVRLAREIQNHAKKTENKIKSA